MHSPFCLHVLCSAAHKKAILCYIYTKASFCVVDTIQKNTTQSELGFSIANHVKIEDRFQAYEKNLFLKRKFNLKNKNNIKFYYIHTKKQKKGIQWKNKINYSINLRKTKLKLITVWWVHGGCCRMSAFFHKILIQCWLNSFFST